MKTQVQAWSLRDPTGPYCHGLLSVGGLGASPFRIREKEQRMLEELQESITKAKESQKPREQEVDDKLSQREFEKVSG